mmetsp:Transcript_4554/g.28892  ORF Transcript_4554/g.28892 Transcript_4554/m.28892 type:complete len:111 (+) Transcript_4554:2621-2953(+)
MYTNRSLELEVYHMPLPSKCMPCLRWMGVKNSKEIQLVLLPGDKKCMIERLSMQTNASYKHLQRHISQLTNSNRNKDQSVCSSRSNTASQLTNQSLCFLKTYPTYTQLPV